jgi:predicted alpha/beta superfamily hydrolase
VKMRLIRVVLTGMLGLCSWPVSAQQELPPYTYVGSELHPLSTTITENQDYLLYIQRPESYEADPERRYPVLYCLDGYWHFSYVSSIIGAMVWDRTAPEILIVGIGYQGDNPDYEVLRRLDYTPVRDPGVVGSGGGRAFLSFLKQEVIPYVEANFRVDDSFRGLGGVSLGGLFTLYAMFEEPDLFQGHIAAAPALGVGHRSLFAQESQFWVERPDEPIYESRIPRELATRLFLAVGSDDQITGLTGDVVAFHEIISRRRYQGLSYKFRLIEGERHASAKIESYSWGIRFVFAEYLAAQQASD